MAQVKHRNGRWIHTANGRVASTCVAPCSRCTTAGQSTPSAISLTFSGIAACGAAWASVSPSSFSGTFVAGQCSGKPCLYIADTGGDLVGEMLTSDGGGGCTSAGFAVNHGRIWASVEMGLSVPIRVHVFAAPYASVAALCAAFTGSTPPQSIILFQANPTFNCEASFGPLNNLQNPCTGTCSGSLFTGGTVTGAML